MKEKDSDFYLRAMGLAPEPDRKLSLSKVLGLDPTPAPYRDVNPFSSLVDLPGVSGTRLMSLSDLALGKPMATPVVPSGGFGAPPLSIRSLAGLPAMQPPVPAAPPRTGIKFQDAVFSEPQILFSEWLPTLPGLYAVLVFDLSGKPRPYRAIYFGKAEDLAARVTSSHEKYNDWTRTCRSVTGLYLVYHPMPNSSDWQRSELERSLIKAYTPECNEKHNPLADAFGF
jgi:hypothetical protein